MFDLPLLAVPHLNSFSPFDFFLQLQNAIQQSLGRGRAARDIDVDWHNSITASHHCIGIVVVTPSIGTAAGVCM